VYIIFFPLFLP